MHNSQKVWEQEYANKRLMTGEKPAKSLVKWIKHIIRKELGNPISKLGGLRALDLGSGEGKNALYLASLGCEVDAIEIARNAVETTQEKITQGGLTSQIRVKQGSIGERFDFADDTFDLVIDVTSSNSLSEHEREVYLRESHRVLKPGGYMFVRALCKDTDKNAKKLLSDFPGPETDTYIIPDWGQTERVFSESDIRALYGTYFDITKLEKETHYTQFGTERYKRNFWVMHLYKVRK